MNKNPIRVDWDNCGTPTITVGWLKESDNRTLDIQVQHSEDGKNNLIISIPVIAISNVKIY
jgi:hypothetical protein